MVIALYSDRLGPPQPSAAPPASGGERGRYRWNRSSGGGGEDVDGAVVVEFVESGGEGGQVGLMDGVGDGHGDLLFAGEFQGEPDVLLGDDHRGRRVLPLPGEEVIDQAHVGSGGAEAELLDEVGDVESGFGSEHQCLLHDHVTGQDD